MWASLSFILPLPATCLLILSIFFLTSIACHLFSYTSFDGLCVYYFFYFYVLSLVLLFRLYYICFHYLSLVFLYFLFRLYFYILTIVFIFIFMRVVLKDMQLTFFSVFIVVFSVIYFLFIVNMTGI